MTAYDDYGMPVGTAYAEPENLPQQAWRVARAFAFYRVKPALERGWRDMKRGGWREGGFRRQFTLVKVCVVLWWVVVYWGERSAIPNSIDACQWDKWEKWVCLHTFFAHNLSGRVMVYMGNSDIRFKADDYSGLWCQSTPFGLRRRPATHRSAYVP